MSHLAMLAPPWIPIPPPAYGGIEQVVSLLTAGLVDAGHRVTLFAPPGSRSPAEVHSPLAEPHPDEIQFSHVGGRPRRAQLRRDRRGARRTATRSTSSTTTPASPRWRWRAGCDAAGAHAARPVRAATLFRFYAVPRDKGSSSRSARAQRDAAPEHLRDGIAVVPNPLAVDEWPFSEDAGRLPAVDRAHQRRQGAAARDRRGARGRTAARARGPGPARAGGVLRPRGRTAHRRGHRCATSARSASEGKRELYTARPGAVDADPVGRSRSAW